MAAYEQYCRGRLAIWERTLLKPPGLVQRTSKRIQNRINQAIPEKVHNALTAAVKGIVKSVQLGIEFAPATPPQVGLTIQQRDERAAERLSTYKKLAAAEGAGTGAGGFVLSLVDFPALIAIKLKFLFELAHVYGFSTKQEEERLFILYIFQLAYSSGDVRARTYRKVRDWHRLSLGRAGGGAGTGANGPGGGGLSMRTFDWHRFQTEYRDTIDLRKMLQLVPGIGAAVGAWVNYSLLEELGTAAMNSYRLRWLTMPE